MPHRPIRYTGPVLADWQEDALTAWQQAERRGTLEVFTGGGKTLLALAAATRTSERVEDLRLAIVVPTQALQAQWVAELLAQTDLTKAEIGCLGGGRTDDWDGRRVLVAVLNTAARKLPDLCRDLDPATLMLVVDECHRAGAPQHSRVLSTRAAYRLGLSATPDREELDEAGEPVAYDEQVLGRELGPVVFSFDLRRAREVGWLPDYRIHHHGVALAAEERRDYDRLSRQVDDLADRLRSLGREPAQARRLVSQPGDLGSTASAYVSATAKRKDLLYRARERTRVTVQVMADTAADPSRKVLLFHERVDQAAALHAELVGALPVVSTLEHSKLPIAARRQALSDFAEDRASVLVSVKSLVEGLNVPAADVGVSVASSSSVRQRVQSLGRVLRRRFDGEVKRADMHIVYVADTVDELIYAKEDWSDLTGGAANRYLLWPLDGSEPELQEAPPRTPKPTEELVWEGWGGELPALPVRWDGALPDLDYSVDTRGNVRTPTGAVVTNPQGIGEMVRGLRGAPGGRFKVTPRHRLAVVFQSQQEGPSIPYVVGQLSEPFALRPEVAEGEVDVTGLKAGDAYHGALDKTGGLLKLRQRHGGVIERRGPGGPEFALVAGAEPPAVAGRQLLAGWRATGRSGMTVSVSAAGHVWFLEDGAPLFLGSIGEGLAWPSDAA